MQTWATRMANLPLPASPITSGMPCSRMAQTAMGIKPVCLWSTSPTPADYHELTVSNGDSAASPNGMMTVAVSQDNERTAEYIYAGDMKGNIWKFYVGGGGWPSGTKLFTAKDSGGLTQSITGGIRIGRAPCQLW
jgi:hypothetical protein